MLNNNEVIFLMAGTLMWVSFHLNTWSSPQLAMELGQTLAPYSLDHQKTITDTITSISSSMLLVM